MKTGISYPPKEQESPRRPGESIRRMMLFLLGLLFAICGTVAFCAAAFGWGLILTMPGLTFMAIAGWAKGETVDSVASVVEEIGR